MVTMPRRLTYVAAVTSCIVAIGYSAALAQRPPASGVDLPSAVGATQSHQAVLSKYCITCHNQRAKTGGFALDTLPLSDVANHAEAWETVVRKVRTGAMPPVGRARPDKAVADSLVTWIEAELDRAAAERLNPGRPTLARLNRSEYTNAVRDLLAVEVDAASMLPADVAGHGFDNNADALTLSPALTERYLGAAAKISQMVLGRPRGLPTPETFFVPTDRDQGTLCRPIAIKARASATICRSDRAVDLQSGTTSRPMASTCSRCGPEKPAYPEDLRGSRRSRTN